MIKTNVLTKFSPNAKKYFSAHLVFFIILLTFVFSIVDMDNLLRNFLLITIFLGLPAYGLMILVYNHWSYIINDNDITINLGIIFKKSKVISLSAIQNINQKHGPIMRLFNIINVEIWTSSQSQLNTSGGKSFNSPDGTIMLSREEAQIFQEYINSFRNRSRQQ